MVQLVIPGPDTAPALEALAGRVFYGDGAAWTAQDFLNLGGLPSAAVIADDAMASALIAVRLVEDEAEVLNMGVAPEAQRQGLGTALLGAVEALASDLGAVRLVLEVASDNTAALGLYAQAGYEEAGRRADYYLRADGTRCDALILLKVLTPEVTPDFW